jgi:hypothetical protein
MKVSAQSSDFSSNIDIPEFKIKENSFFSQVSVKEK